MMDIESDMVLNGLLFALIIAFFVSFIHGIIDIPEKGIKWW